MEVKFYLPYYDYNDGAFDVSNDYYGENEYSKLMTEEYEKSKDIVYNSVMEARNGSRTLLEGQDGQTYKFGEKTYENEQKVAYSSCDGSLITIDGEDESVDGFIEKFASQKQFLEMIELNLDSSEEEFETELSLWIKEHINIVKYGEKLGDEWVLSKEPKRNLRVVFVNKSNETIYAILEDCMIMEIVDNKSFIVIVKKIRLIDKFL